MVVGQDRVYAITRYPMLMCDCVAFGAGSKIKFLVGRVTKVIRQVVQEVRPSHFLVASRPCTSSL